MEKLTDSDVLARLIYRAYIAPDPHAPLEAEALLPFRAALDLYARPWTGSRIRRMDKNEFMLIPQEQRDQILRTFHTFVDSVAEAIQSLAGQLAPVIKGIVDGLAMLSYPSDDALRRYASPKEWAIYKRTKKRRIRKKYRDRFIRRWAGGS